MSEENTGSSEGFALTPLAIRKMRFATRMRGYDAAEVDEFLEVVAETLARAVTANERLEQEARRLQQALAKTELRERELQETLTRAQKVSEEIMATSHREAQLLVKEAELTADRIVEQAISRAQDVEGKISELSHRRRELQLKLKGSLELFARILEADMSEDETRATIHHLAREHREGAG